MRLHSVRTRRVIGLESDGELVPLNSSKSGDDGYADFEVDFDATSGVTSRWNLVLHLMKQAVTYPHRATEARKNLVFIVAKPSNVPLSIVGSVWVQIALELTAPNASDAVIFAYLEAVDPESPAKVTYISEGMVRASHVPSTTKYTRSTARVGAFDLVKRTFSRADMQPLNREPTTVDILLEPIAMEVPVGWQLRLSLAGADKDNFLVDNIDGLSTRWRVHTGGQSQIHIPVQTI